MSSAITGIRFRSIATILTATIAASAAGATAVFAQQGEQVQPQSRASTVLKNRAPVAKDVLTVHLPRPKEFTLPARSASGETSGARVLVVEDHRLPLITITVSMKAGSLFNNAEKPAVAQLTADMLTEGTEHRTALQIAQETARIGATLDASAGAERATVTISGPAEQLNQLVDLLSDVLLHSTFPADRLDKMKFQAVQQRLQREASPQYAAGQLARQVLYGADTPYGRPDPTAAQIQAVTPDDVLAFYHSHYLNVPATLIGVAGDIKPKDVQSKLQAALGKWPGAAAGGTAAPVTLDDMPPGTFTPKEKTAVYVVDRPGSAQTVLTFANIGIRRTDPDYFPLLVANYVLGGNANSRLFQKLREDKGYTYGAYSSLSTPKYPGIWGASASVRNAVTIPATTEFLNEFARIQSQPVSDTELDFAKRAIVGSFALTLESPSAILGRLLDVVDYGLPSDYWDTYPKRVQAVTAADVQRVAQKYLGSGRIQIIAVGERKDIESGLAADGPVTALTADQVFNPGH